MPESNTEKSGWSLDSIMNAVEDALVTAEAAAVAAAPFTGGGGSLAVAAPISWIGAGLDAIQAAKSFYEGDTGNGWQNVGEAALGIIGGKMFGKTRKLIELRKKGKDLTKVQDFFRKRRYDRRLAPFTGVSTGVNLGNSDSGVYNSGIVQGWTNVPKFIRRVTAPTVPQYYLAGSPKMNGKTT